MKILIVENMKILNNFIKLHFQDRYKIYQAFSLKEAKEILKKESIDVILLDLFLEDGNGINFLNKIDTKKIKVIIITSYEDDSAKNILYKKGIIDYIYKTTDYELMIEQINQNLENIIKHKESKIMLIDNTDKYKNEISQILKNRELQLISKVNCQNIKNIDLILLNVNCPKILTKLQTIKNKNPYLPIIGVYEKLNSNEYRLLRKKGINDFIRYPFNAEKLLLKLNNWLDYYHKFKHLNDNIEDLIIALKNEIKKNIEKEKFLRTQARKAQMGEMLAIIAHQLKQPINHISLSNYFLKEYINGNETKENAIEATKQIDISTQYITDTIDLFKDFFKPNKKREKTTLKDVVNQTLLILKPIIQTSNIKINIKELDNSEIKILKNDLIQVIINLIKNSIEALNEKNIKNPTITIILEKRKLIIKDNAGGIPEKVMKKLFKPYVSTKGEKGTGLGLYMSKMIVEDILHGKINVYNDENGAVFEITL